MLPNQIVNIVGPKPENAKAGVGENLTRRPATEDGFQAIFEAPKFLQNRVFEAPRLALTKTLVVGLKNVFREYSVRDSQNFPSGDPLENSFQRVSRNGFQGAILAELSSSLLVAPPFGSAPKLASDRKFSLLTWGGITARNHRVPGKSKSLNRCSLDCAAGSS